MRPYHHRLKGGDDAKVEAEHLPMTRWPLGAGNTRTRRRGGSKFQAGHFGVGSETFGEVCIDLGLYRFVRIHWFRSVSCTNHLAFAHLGSESGITVDRPFSEFLTSRCRRNSRVWTGTS